MGAAAHNRGSVVISREADGRAREAQPRLEREAWGQCAAALRARIEVLEGRLRKAERCRATLRGTLSVEREQRREEEALNKAVIRQLTRIAFGGR